MLPIPKAYTTAKQYMFGTTQDESVEMADSRMEGLMEEMLTLAE